MPKKEKVEPEKEKETTSDSILELEKDTSIPEVEETKPKKRAKRKSKVKEVSIMDIPGIGPAMAAKLQEADFHTLESVSVANATELSYPSQMPLNYLLLQKLVLPQR
jgi:predicted flap endonuclease-1-like 5' DNA nuclease